MGFEKGDHLLLGRDLFFPQDTALGLVDHSGGKFDVALQVLLKTQGQKGLLEIGEGARLDLGEDVFCIADGLLGDLEKILVLGLSRLLVLGVYNPQHPALGPAGVIGKRGAYALQTFPGPVQEACDDADSVIEQRRVRGGVDIESDHGAVDAGPTPGLSRCPGPRHWRSRYD